jgi:ABC-type sugar transport system substrate-binding protein
LEKWESYGKSMYREIHGKNGKSIGKSIGKSVGKMGKLWEIYGEIHGKNGKAMGNLWGNIW